MSDDMHTRRQVLKAGTSLFVGVVLGGCKNENHAGDERQEASPAIQKSQRPRDGSAHAKPKGPLPTLGWETIASGTDGPGPRSRHGLVYDRKARAVVLFGGTIGGGSRAMRLKSDTWELKGESWSQISISVPPPAIHRGAMVYCDNIESTLLFGGQGAKGQMFGDTWIYTAGDWRLRSDIAGPPPRCGHCMAYDSVGHVVLFGGIKADGVLDQSLDDTWIFDGTSWTKLDIKGPPARRYAAFAYDPQLGGCLLHGGSADDFSRIPFGDAWLFQKGNWKRLPETLTTTARDDHGLCYHRRANRMVLLEGLSGTRGVLVRENDQWKKVAAHPIHPRHQCSPLAWNDDLGGIIMHGGEARAFGPPLEETLLLRMPAS
jgi:hypothetical protein